MWYSDNSLYVIDNADISPDETVNKIMVGVGGGNCIELQV